MDARGIIGNYIVERELGRGGMGVVYAAKHRVLGRPAAIKVLLANTIEHRDRVERFFNEARAAMAIEHPGIVKIYDVGIAADDRAYIAMELLDGHSLATVLRRGPLPLRLAIDYARRLADALAAAHDAGVIHRDLKPENIILAGDRIVIVDFGIAKLQGGSTVRTATGALIGTPLYMSPEQCEGLREVDARTDLYSLGCVIFAMATGRPPFEGGGTGGLIGMHLHVPPPLLRARCPSASEAFERVVSVLLAKSADQRFRTARAVGAALADPTVSVILSAVEGPAATADFPQSTTGGATVATGFPPPQARWSQGVAAAMPSHGARSHGAPPQAARPGGDGETVDTMPPGPQMPAFVGDAVTGAPRPVAPHHAPVLTQPAAPRRGVKRAVAVGGVVAVIVAIALIARCASSGSSTQGDGGTVAIVGSGVPDAPAVVEAVVDAATPITVGSNGSGSDPTRPITGSGTGKPKIDHKRDGRGSNTAGKSGSSVTLAQRPDPTPPDAAPEPDAAPVRPPPQPIHERVRFGFNDFRSSAIPQAVVDRVTAAHRADPTRRIVLTPHVEPGESRNLESLATARLNAVRTRLNQVSRSVFTSAPTVVGQSADGSNRGVDIDID